MRPAAIKNQLSSGGVIYRSKNNSPEIVLISVKGGTIFCLPKGIVDKGENPEQTALREVREETGLNGKIEAKLGEVSYWYYIKEENARCRKTVHFYLMQYLSGSTMNHDSEVDDASWFPIDEAIAKASYKGEKEIILKAKEMIKKKGLEAQD